MNPKLEELKEQSYIQEIEYNEYNGAGYYVNEFSEEKFAELIVEECCNWIDHSPSTESGQLIHTKFFIIANIKNIFGIE
jgi:hypothetical protein